MDDFYKDALRFGAYRCARRACPSSPRRPPGALRVRLGASSPVANIQLFARDPAYGAQGFKHFSVYLRGREELLITVHHRDDPGPFPSNDAIQDRRERVEVRLPRPRRPHSPSRSCGPAPPSLGE